MKVYLSRRYMLSASHRLYCESYPDEKNREVYGKCANPHGHGHNYIVEVTVGGQVDPIMGMVCDLSELDSCVRNKVIDRFDHTNLNLDMCFANEVPTTENFCVAVYELVTANFLQADVERVRVEETPNNFFEYGRKGKHGTASSRS